MRHFTLSSEDEKLPMDPREDVLMLEDPFSANEIVDKVAELYDVKTSS